MECKACLALANRISQEIRQPCKIDFPKNCLLGRVDRNIIFNVRPKTNVLQTNNRIFC